MSLADDPRAYLRQARDLIKQGEPNAAADLLAVARALAPDDLDVASALADCHHRAGRPGEATAIWREIVEIGPVDTVRRMRVQLKLSRAAAAAGRSADAIEHLTRHVQADPGDHRSALHLLKLRLDAEPQDRRRATVLNHLAGIDRLGEADLLLTIYVDAACAPQRAVETILADPSRFADQPDLAADAFKVVAGVDREHAIAFGQALSVLFPEDARFAHVTIAELPASDPDGADAGVGSRRDSVAEIDPLSAMRQHSQRRDWASAVAILDRMLASDAFDVDIARLGMRAALALDDRHAVDRCIAGAVAALSHRHVDGIRVIAALESMAGDPTAALARLAPLYEQPVTRSTVLGDFARAAMEAGRYRDAWSPLADALDASLPEDQRLRDLAIQCSAALASTPASAHRFPEALFEVALARPPRDVATFEPGLVALVTSTLAAGGAERQVALTARGLAARRSGSGFRTVLIGRNFDPARGYDAMLADVRMDGLDVEETRRNDPEYAMRRLHAERLADRAALRLIAAFPERLRHDILRLLARFLDLKPEVVHLWQDGSISVGAVAAVLAGVPRIVASVRNMAPRLQDRRRSRPYLRTLYRALAARPDVRLTANSAAGAADYEESYGLPTGSVTVLRNGIELDRIRARASTERIAAVRARCNLTKRDSVVGGVFRLVPAKRPVLWLEAADMIARKRPETRFILVGDGAMRSALERQAAQLGLSERLMFAGAQSPVEPWLAVMNVMLLTSDVEGLPNVVLEAQAVGVPVVAADAGGTREALQDGATGRIVASSDALHFASAVGTILDDADLRRSMSRAGPDFVRERFDLERMIDATLAGYGLLR